MTAEVADNTVLSRILSNGDTSVFVPSTDGLQPIRDRGDAEWVTGGGGAAPTVGEIRTEMEGAGTKLTLALEDTNELQTNQGNWVTATGFLDAAGVRTAIGLASANLDTQIGLLATEAKQDIIDANIDQIETAVITNAAGADIAADIIAIKAETATIVGYLDTEIAAILADTNELQTDWTNGGRLDLLIDAIKAKTDNQPEGFKKNTAYTNFPFFMVLSSDHITPATGKTVTCQRSIDDGAFAACANSASETGSGKYCIDLAASDLNGSKFVTFKFTETDCDQRTITIKLVD